KDLLVGRVAEHHRIAGLARRGDARWIEIERDVFETLRLEHARHVLADASETAENDVIAPSDFSRRGAFALEGGARRSRLPQQETRDTLVVVEEERTQEHGEHDRHEERLAEARRDESRRKRDRAERHAEFAADRDDETGTQRLEQ